MKAQYHFAAQNWEDAQQRGFQLILDRASDNGIIFASPSIDISNEVLAKLGYSK